eukprot:GHVU01122364.1.p2 GENE.GHVU01122364.1~~GHVU01122364.1.p2  ORF type:complete len:134 (+),score=3.76 GHVU01122364.1:141-542(+)
MRLDRLMKMNMQTTAVSVAASRSQRFNPRIGQPLPFPAEVSLKQQMRAEIAIRHGCAPWDASFIFLWSFAVPTPRSTWCGHKTVEFRTVGIPGIRNFRIPGAKAPWPFLKRLFSEKFSLPTVYHTAIPPSHIT